MKSPTAPLVPLGAVVAFGFAKWDVGEEIAIVRDAGIRRVQVYRSLIQALAPAAIRRTLDEAGLAIDSFHGYIEVPEVKGPRLDLSSPDPATRRQALGLARGEAAFARALGCRDVILHPAGPGDTEHEPRRREALAETAEEMARIGREAGVRFLLENMPPPMFGRDAAMLRQIVEAIDSPHLGLAYDSGHAGLAGDPAGIVRAMAPRLWGIHLHDNAGREDDHLLPGMGVVPLEDVARALAEVGFRGTFMIEVYRDTKEVRRDLTPARLRYIHHLARLASGLPSEVEKPARAE